jgi:hypothetical protein
VPARKLHLATFGQGHATFRGNPRGLARVVATLYVGQKEDITGCVHARLDMPVIQEYLRNCDAMTALPN